MALQSSANSADPLKLSEIKTQFGGGTPPNNLRSYLRGAGYVRSHGVNSNIPSSGTVEILDFLGSSKNFNANITPGTKLIVSGSFPNFAQNNYKGYLGGVDLVVSGVNRGPFGSITQTQYGTSVSSTSSATLFAVYRYQEAGSLIFEFTGNWTTNPSIFTSITVGSATYNRSSAAVAPTYNSTYNYTLWYWTGVTTDIFASDPTSFVITP